MFRFENPEYLYLLLALPLLAGLFLLVMRHYKQVRRHLCDARLFRSKYLIIPGNVLSPSLCC